ncbi:MAG: gamma carbonic anhydrase family protein [Burkholderiaceae bacterium]
MPIYRLGDHAPDIDPSAYIADSADIIGRVRLARDTSIWSHVSIRGDNDDIVIDEGTNIQEGSVLHVDAGTPMHIGAHVTVGHQAMLHGCTVRENSLIGMQAIVLNGAVIGRNVLVGAGALIPEGKIIPDNVLVIGIGKIQRELTESEIAGLHQNNLNYIERARMFRTQLQRM